MFVCFLSPWHNLELSGKSQLKRCFHHIGLSSICCAFSWLIIHVERLSPLLVMPPQAGDADCTHTHKNQAGQDMEKKTRPKNVSLYAFHLCSCLSFCLDFFQWWTVIRAWKQIIPFPSVHFWSVFYNNSKQTRTLT